MNGRTALASALLFVLLAVGAAACNRPSGDEPGSCDPERLVAPDPTSPAHHSIISDLSPTFRWTYPDYTCLPEEYRVVVSSSDSWFDSGPILAEATLSGTTSSWDPDLTLTPGDIYYFFVYARQDGTGPGQGIFFWTEPLCSESGDAIQAPVLVAPTDGERLTAMRAHLRWDDPTPCVSMSHYWIEVSRSHRFTDAYVGWTSIFEDEALPNDEFSLDPCTTYYWRVRSGSNGASPDGPYSETWSFTTPAEPGMVCMITPVITSVVPWTAFRPPASAHGALAGYVFHDECAVPYETTETVPPGCVILPDGRLEANGVLDAGEAGIEGVTVELWFGACPGDEPGGYVLTDASGHYTFDGLQAATYCLSIDAAADGNEAILIPGNWTMPYRWYGAGPITAEVTLLGDDDISRLNHFGWDYQFLPSPAGAPSGTPLARVLTDARCRLGPGLNYPILTYLSQGMSFPIIGRLEQGGWWQLRAPELDQPCWIGEDVIEPSGDLTAIPLAVPPTRPTDEPTQEPPSGCWCVNPQQNPPCIHIAPCPASCKACTP